MSKSNTTTDQISLQLDPTLGTILPTNYPSLEYLSWFMADTQNVQNLTRIIFNGGLNTSDQRLVDLLATAVKAIGEIEDDVVKLKEFLATYVPPNSN